MMNHDKGEWNMCFCAKWKIASISQLEPEKYYFDFKHDEFLFWFLKSENNYILICCKIENWRKEERKRKRGRERKRAGGREREREISRTKYLKVIWIRRWPSATGRCLLNYFPFGITFSTTSSSIEPKPVPTTKKNRLGIRHST